MAERRVQSGHADSCQCGYPECVPSEPGRVLTGEVTPACVCRDSNGEGPLRPVTSLHYRYCPLYDWQQITNTHQNTIS